MIPARNEAAYLPLTLRAIEKQTHAPREVIVVDNGSHDGTASIARAWGARVIPCYTPGVAATRQLGLEAAQTDWIASTDADSVPSPVWLEKMHAATQRPHCVALYGPLRFTGVSPALRHASEWGYTAFVHSKRVFGKVNLAGANMVFPRQLALEVGGYPQVEAYEDVKLGKELIRRGKAYFVPGALVETSARRLEQGIGRFLWQQLKNSTGHTRGYFRP